MNKAARQGESPATILVAEDSPTQAEQLRHTLEQHGYAVEVSANGRIALESAARVRPALIISDVVMPEMDGYELSRRIKADRVLRDTPIILVTTMSDPDDVIRGLECGADNFVLKPYDQGHLLGRVEYLLKNGRAGSGGDSDRGIHIHFNARDHLITADRLQILNLLLSTYDAAIERTKELQRSHEQLKVLHARLNEANKELESFAFSVSHDLRAPLRHIDGYGAMLMQELAGSLSPEAARYLREMTSASRRMGQLIEDMLEFSRSGRATLRETRVDLCELVKAAIRELEMSSAGRDIDWSVAPLPAVRGDPAMLKQVFANLLGNAVKYSRTRDRARIEIGAAGEDGGRLVVFVRDNGVGFDMNYVHRLFEPFSRLHSTDEFEGTGVGLATVRRIVARHGGRVWAEAAPGRGATFYLTLAAAGSAVSQSAA